ncbi:MAG TPA: DotU family type IV/VI secretion system protein [Bryobacteraceae bacterium]|nr:DotU family type IV/VI secretion system protein [Bryobacteraceae bacterium]HPT25032.1 DotU family type IV/VI secretion system protein [Bryobacteraceae bacterium]
MNPNEAQSSAPQLRRTENLALAFQEVLTAIVRLRSGRQDVTDAELFRQQVRAAMRAAHQESIRLGYVDEDVRLAVFATVAFLDESVLNLQNPAFAEWVRKPLQEEMFGRHTAGEIFFENLKHLLGRRETHELADLLEVHQQCLLLGFAGRYSLSGRGELHALIEAVEDKIRRIRQPHGEISPYWRIPNQAFIQGSSDPWVKRFMWVASGCAGMAVLCFVLYKLMLGSGLSALESMASTVTK